MKKLNHLNRFGGIDSRVQLRTPLGYDSIDAFLKKVNLEDQMAHRSFTPWKPFKMRLFEGQRSKVFGSVIMAEIIKTGRTAMSSLLNP